MIIARVWRHIFSPPGRRPSAGPSTASRGELVSNRDRLLAAAAYRKDCRAQSGGIVLLLLLLILLLLLDISTFLREMRMPTSTF